MKVFCLRIIFIGLFLSISTILVSAGNHEIPCLIVKNNIPQLLVDGTPFLILGGELGNSATSDKDEMKSLWPKLQKMHLNTVLAPVYWELMEPNEGRFDFALVDAMINQARENNLHLVLLWFGTWKNSMSCYTPEWIKKDYKRFPRTLDKTGYPSEIVSAFSEQALNADMKAFSTLLEHIKAVDADHHTVIMIQVENEIGQLPDARDYSNAANRAFQSEVPSGLIDYLTKNKSILLPHIKNLWGKNGCRQKGNWEAVFGNSLATDELFSAWFFAVYADKVAEAGKAVYNLPMYVNCALNRPNLEPGKYPSGGPLPHLINIWQAAAPHINMLSPDIYHGDFRTWCNEYDKLNNPVFVPEIKQNIDNATQVFYVVGHCKALGFSPFNVEATPENSTLQNSYELLQNFSDIILTNREKSNGCYLDKEHKVDTLLMGDYELIVAHDNTLGWNAEAKEAKWTPSGCIIVERNPGEFWIGGTGVVCTFKNIKKKDITTGLLSVDVCKKEMGRWTFKRINGDATNQGRFMRIPNDEWEIQRVRLYDYK